MDQRSVERKVALQDQLHVPTTGQLSTQAYKQHQRQLIYNNNNNNNNNHDNVYGAVIMT